MTPEEKNESKERAVDRVLSLVEQLYETIVDDILDRTEVVEVKRFGQHELTRFRDGRVVCLSRRRWDGDSETPLRPTPYELIQVGEDPPPLAPVTLSPWQMAVGSLPGLIGGTLAAWAARGLRRRWR